MQTNPVDLCVASTGMSRAEIAKRLGISRTAVNKWNAKGVIPLRRIKEVSELTGVPMNLLSDRMPRFSKEDLENK